MPWYRRAKNGSTFFFTVVTYQRNRILCLEASRRVLREVVLEIRSSHPFDIEAWVLLPDHMHCMWTLPKGDSNYPMRWGWIKKEFTKRIRTFMDVDTGGSEGFECAGKCGDEAPGQVYVGTAHPTHGGVGRAQQDSRMRRREGVIWQRRYWEHMIRDEKDFSAHFDYIHFNPVKHGLVSRTADWPFSTFHRSVREGIYPESWGCLEIQFSEDIGRE